MVPGVRMCASMHGGTHTWIPQLGMFLACFHGPVTISQLSTVNTHSMSAHDTTAAWAYGQWLSVGCEHPLACPSQSRVYVAKPTANTKHAMP